MPEGETHQFEVTISDLAARIYSSRTILVICETFAQAEKFALENANLHKGECITEISMDWEPL